MGYADRTTLNNLTPNLDIGDVADPALRLAAFQYLYNLSDENYNYLQSLVTSGTLSPIPPDFLNRQSIINGNFDRWERGSSFTLASGSSAYTADRFKSLNNTSGASATVSQVTIFSLSGSKYGLQMVHAATPSNFGRLTHQYTLEAADSYKLAGMQVTLSCKVLAVGNINKFSAIARYRTTEGAITTASTSIAVSSTITINNVTWTMFTFTFTVPTSANLTASGVFGVELVGSNPVSEASGDGFIIAQVGLNTLDVALPFQPQSYGDVVSHCQRYTFTLVDESNTTLFGYGFAASTTIAFIQVTFPVTMRIQPSLVATAADLQITDGITPIDVTAISIQPNQNGRNTVTLRVTVASGLTAFKPYQLNAKSASKLMIFDAEL